MSEEKVEEKKVENNCYLTNQMIMDLFGAFDIAIKSPNSNHDLLFKQKFEIQESLVKSGAITIK